MTPPAVDDEAGTMTMTSRANPAAEPKGDEDTDDVRGGGTPVDEDGGGMLAFMMISARAFSATHTHRNLFPPYGWRSLTAQRTPE
jgi:hypothetical protein